MAAAPSASPAARPLRILVVDDSAVSRFVLAAIVESLGHRCAVAADGEAALALMRAGHADIVLMDAVMPGLDGFATTRAARALPPPQRPQAIIGVSASAGGRAVAAFHAAGADLVIAKPVVLANLVAAIAAARAVPAL